MTLSNRLRPSIAVRVLGAVLSAGLVTLALITLVAVELVETEREAELVDSSIRTSEGLRTGFEHTVELGRARARTVALAAEAGRHLSLPELLSSWALAIRCRRGDAELLEAAADSESLRAITGSRPLAPGQIRVVGRHRLLLSERVGDVDALVLVELPLRVPPGWRLRVAKPGRSTPTGEALSGSVVAHREVGPDGEEWLRVVVPTRSGVTLTVHSPMRPAREAAMRITRRILLAALMVLLPLAVIALLLSRAVTKPIRALARAVRDARDGPVVLPPLGRDEIGDLGRAIQGMSERLHADARVQEEAVALSRRTARLLDPTRILAALEEGLRNVAGGDDFRVLPRSDVDEGRVPADDDRHRRVVIPLGRGGRDYGVVVGRVLRSRETDPRHAEILCETAVAALRNAEVVRSSVANEKLAVLGRLAAGVAHEVNNPLNYVLVNLRTLEDELSGESRALVIDSRTGVERVARIIADLSSLFRGGQDVQVESVDLAAVATAVAKVARARRPTVPLDVVAPAPVRVACDPMRIEQALLNLAANALDATRERTGGRVRIRVERRGELAVVEVEDDGRGVPAAVRSHLFEAFHTTKGEEGTGLGLFLSRSFAQASGGGLELAWTGEGGSCFRLTLPASRTQRPPDAHRPELDRPSTRTDGRRVLVVDDEPAIVRALVRYLRRDAEVDGTTDPYEGLALAQARRPDLIVCDMRMPGMTGLEFIDSLRARDPELARRVVIVTGSVTTVSTDATVLRKPLDPADLRRILEGTAPR